MRFALFAFFVCLSSFAAVDWPLTYDGIQKYLSTHPEVQTVDAFLHELPREALTHYVLMHTSSSLQGSSFERPRVLTAALDGNFALAFTDAQHARGNTVEMYAFDRAKRAFEFRELTFDGQSPPKLSAPNPPLCLGCHGQDPRPIWGSYPVWKGAYAEYRPSGVSDDPPDIVAKNEAFYRAQRGLPRYRELFAYPPSDQSDHNVGFMHILQEANNLRVARLMTTSPFYEDYKLALLGAHLCLEESDGWLNKFLPVPLAEQHRAKYRPEFHLDTRPGAFQLYTYLFEPRAVSSSSWPTMIDPLDPRSSSRFSITDPVDFDSFSAGRLAYALATVDQELAQPAHLSTPSQNGIVTLDPREFYYLQRLESAECESLATKSRERLAKLLQQHGADEVFRLSGQAPNRTPREVLQSCATCHGGADARIPRIPFEDVASLSAWLTSHPGARELVLSRLSPNAGTARMPPGNPLPETERATLESFLREL